MLFPLHDDTFIITSTKEAGHELLSDFNKLHPNIGFTCESVEGNAFHFLDVGLQRRGNAFITSVYRKPTFTGLYTSYYSFVPQIYKINVVRSLFTRSRRICSSSEIQAEEQFLTSILLKNGYPLEFIRKHSQQATEKQVFFGPEKKKVFVKLPYKGNASEVFARRELRRLLSSYSATKLNLTFSTMRLPIRSPKDPTPMLSQSSIIYKFSCSCGSSYVGRTGRRLSDRLVEHVPQWLHSESKKPPRSRKPPQSAVTRHLQVCDNPASCAKTSFRVIHRHQNVTHLRILEALAIKRESPDLCIQKDFVLSLILPW